MTRSVTVVTVTYGERADLVRATLTGAYHCGVRDFVVVENGSDGLSADELIQAIPGIAVEVVKLQENTGSAGGFATGIELALARGSDDLWLLDDDNWPEAASLRRLQRARAKLAEESAAGIAGVAAAAMRPADQRYRRLVGGAMAAEVDPFPGEFMAFDLWRYLRRGGRRKQTSSPQVQDPIALQMAPYGGLLVPREVLLAGARPNCQLFLYEDDYEFTERLVESGLQIFLIPEAVVQDLDGKFSDGSGELSGPSAFLRSEAPLKLYYSLRNRSYLDRRRAKGAVPVARFGLNVVIYLMVIGFGALRGDAAQRSNAALMLKAIWRGVRGDLQEWSVAA